MIMQEKFKNVIKRNSKFYSIRRNSNIDYDIYRIFNALPLNITSIQKSPQNSHRPMGIHHSPYTHPIPIPMGISMGISIPTAALQMIRTIIDDFNRNTMYLNIYVKFCANTCNNDRVMAVKSNSRWWPPPSWFYFRCQFWSYDHIPVGALDIPTKFSARQHNC